MATRTPAHTAKTQPRIARRTAITVLSGVTALCVAAAGSGLTPASAAPQLSVAAPGQASAPIVVLTDTVPVETPVEGDPDAPEAFAVDGETIYIADQVHNTMRTYTKGRLTRVTDMQGIGAIDLQVTEAGLIVLDTESGVHRLDVSGPIVRQIAEPQQLEIRKHSFAVGESLKVAEAAQLTVSVPASRLDMMDREIVARFDQSFDISVNASAAARKTVPSKPAETFRTVNDGFEVLGSNGDVVKRMLVPYGPEYVEPLHRGDGFDYYLAVDGHVNSQGAMIFNRYVFKFAASGDPVSVYTLVASDSPHPNRDVQIAGGEVFQLWIDRGAAHVLKLVPDAPRKLVRVTDSSLVKDSDSELAGNRPVLQAAAAASASVPKVKLYNVELGALAYSEYTWTYTKATNGSHKPAGVKQPRYLASIESATKKVKGVPYNWGGIAVPDFADTSVTSNFTAAVKDGKYTGNISNATDSIVAGTTGIDCSGLVSALFSLDRKYGSSQLIGSKYFPKVSTTNPKPGDIIRHPGHVVIYLGKSGKKWVIAESTTAGQNTDRVMVWDRDRDEFSDWQVGRYPNLDNAPI